MDTTTVDKGKEILKTYSEKGMFEKEYLFGDKCGYVSIYVILTQGCDAACPFCYQPKDFRKSDAFMTQQVARDAVRFFMGIIPERQLRFHLFGGEPFTNFPTLKYLVEKFPMIKFSVTTNGLVICANPEIQDWIREHKQNLTISGSVIAQRVMLGDSYMENVKPLLDVINHNGGEIHYVVEDPTEAVYQEIKQFFEYGVNVKISTANGSPNLINKKDQFIALFKRIADYVYFGETPRFNQCKWDMAFNGNHASKFYGDSMKDLPPVFCGTGHTYMAVDRFGGIYPCDYFIAFPEFKLGDIYSGIDGNALFFQKMGDWAATALNDCYSCPHIPDLRLCPRAQCLAENYEASGNPLKPTTTHCAANGILYEIYDYILNTASKVNLLSFGRGSSYAINKAKC